MDFSRLMGAIEAFCERNGLNVSEEAWDWYDWVRASAARSPAASHAEVGNRGHDTSMWIAMPGMLDSDELAGAWAAGRGAAIDDAVAEAVAVDLAANPSAPHSAAPAMEHLTKRELEVLTLLCERLTDPEIADRLYLSSRTIEGHVTHILGKLGVRNRRDAAAVAIRLALI